jgi:hypothetical protein
MGGYIANYTWEYHVYDPYSSGGDNSGTSAPGGELEDIAFMASVENVLVEGTRDPIRPQTDNGLNYIGGAPTPIGLSANPIETVVVTGKKLTYPPSSVKQVQCIFQAMNKHKVALASDAAGIPPGEGNAWKATQLAASAIGAINSAISKNPWNAFSNLFGYHLTAFSMFSVSLKSPTLKIVPILGNAISAYSFEQDIFAAGGVNDDYNLCMTSP